MEPFVKKSAVVEQLRASDVKYSDLVESLYNEIQEFLESQGGWTGNLLLEVGGEFTSEVLEVIKKLLILQFPEAVRQGLYGELAVYWTTKQFHLMGRSSPVEPSTPESIWKYKTQILDEVRKQMNKITSQPVGDGRLFACAEVEYHDPTIQQIRYMLEESGWKTDLVQVEINTVDLLIY